MSMNRVGLMGLVVLLSVVPAQAADTLHGSDAAYLDWAVVTCEFKTTVKEHELADAANRTGGAAYQQDFQQQRAKLLAPLSPTAQTSRCEEMKDWYGPSGSKIAGLLTWPQAPQPGVPVGKKTGSEGGGKGGGRRNKGGGS